jgi:hypothetical protein
VRQISFRVEHNVTKPTLADRANRRARPRKVIPPNPRLDDPFTQIDKEKKKGGEPGLLASLLFPFRGIRLA